MSRWTWVWVRDGDEMMWSHIFVTFCHIPGSMWRCQVSKKFFLVLPKTIFLELGTNVTISSHRHIIFLGSAGNKTQFQNLARSWVLGSRFSNSSLERPSEAEVEEYIRVVSVRQFERIFPSINFSSEFSRIHAKENQKSFDPTKAKCCKLVHLRWKTRSSTFQALSFRRIFQQKRPMKNDAPAH